MRRSLAILVAVAAVAPGLAFLRADDPRPPKDAAAGRAKLLALDADLAAAADRAAPQARRKLPEASAASFNWVRVLGQTPIHAQGAKPSCVAQAAVAALEWNCQLRNGTKAKPVLSPQPILDRLGKAGNLRYVEALDQLLLHGTATIASYPYAGEPQKLPRKLATPYRLVGWGAVARPGESSAAGIKEALLEHGPLVAGVHASDAFKGYKGGVFAEHASGIPAKDPTNHAVVIVGWDDRRGKGCWLVQNSWGPGWGEGGGMWIEYGCNNVGHAAYWLRAQSARYNLPKDAHRLLGDEAEAFRRWPAARDLAVKPAE
jgi:C1A family cysteine protease